MDDTIFIQTSEMDDTISIQTYEIEYIIAQTTAIKLCIK